MVKKTISATKKAKVRPAKMPRKAEAAARPKKIAETRPLKPLKLKPKKLKPPKLKPWTSAEVRDAFQRFQKANPDPRGELEHLNPFTLVVAVALSAQATDA